MYLWLFPTSHFIVWYLFISSWEAENVRRKIVQSGTKCGVFTCFVFIYGLAWEILALSY